MQFNTMNFLWFCLIMLLVYWPAYKKSWIQNTLLVLGSYYFYSCLHISFPIYLFALTAAGYFFGLAINNSIRYRKALLFCGIVVISSCLIILKYSNFGIEIINAFGPRFDMLKFLLPIGLSFYTLSSIGYITDVYRRRITAEANLITYGAYISFFPHLLAGPIPTATEILPQFKNKRTFKISDAEPALQQILWGLFKKMVIADNISIPVNYCFSHTASLNSLGLYLGIVLFSFQIYADFSGYSDIARGVAKMFGIDLVRNFNAPFLSRNPAEAWRRWHTSLNKWLTDYIYRPLGGRHASRMRYSALVIFIFIFSGLWHGANWTFVLWGLVNALYFLPYIFTRKLVRYTEPPCPGKRLPDLKTFFQIIFTFHLITFSRILFKSADVSNAKNYFLGLVTQHSLNVPPAFLFYFLPWCLLLVVIEWAQRFRSHALDINATPAVRYAVYAAVVIVIIFWHKSLSSQEYYYFRF